MVTTKVEAHLGHLVLREAKVIELARVPVNGDRWQDSVILHPRYVPKEVEHEIFIARVYRRGRTVDLFLDEPITVDSVAYGILNFKGVGADLNGLGTFNEPDLVIHPDKWYDGLNWVPRKEGDCHGRVWGAVTKGKSRREFPARLFHEHNIPHAPHVALNEIPPEIADSIRKHAHGKERHRLVQLVRGLQTNIRIDNYGLLSDEQKEDLDISTSARADASLINAQFTLARKGKMLGFVGQFEENQFIDGKYTDAENLYCDKLGFGDAADFIVKVVRHYVGYYSPVTNTKFYFEELSRETGLDCNLGLVLWELKGRIISKLEEIVPRKNQRRRSGEYDS